eukprot:913612-Prymnesium_polylepis.1
MSGRTATWRQPVHSTFATTVNERVGRLPWDQDLHCALASSTRLVRLRHSIAECARGSWKEIFPGNLSTLVFPSLRQRCNSLSLSETHTLTLSVSLFLTHRDTHGQWDFNTALPCVLFRST